MRSQKKRHRTHTCGGKTRYRDKREAVAAVHHFAVNSTRHTIPTRAYECPGCNGWHLTKMTHYSEAVAA